MSLHCPAQTERGKVSILGRQASVRKSEGGRQTKRADISTGMIQGLRAWADGLRI